MYCLCVNVAWLHTVAVKQCETTLLHRSAHR
uniref:Uncharacterized protein n=1 Tax=Anguilla anguilla TaxID=7936 RepID=A0A0E9R8H2_ANGAN